MTKKKNEIQKKESEEKTLKVAALKDDDVVEACPSNSRHSGDGISPCRSSSGEHKVA